MQLVVASADEREFQVTVPSVVGLLSSQAEARLAQSRLQLRVEKEQEHEAPKGTVVSQQPTAWTVVDLRRQTAVAVVLSSGRTLVEVPDVKGHMASVAFTELSRSRLRSGQIARSFSDQPAGVVLNQSPSPGAQVPPDTEVSLTVSAGAPAQENPPPDATTTTVPDLVGRTLEAAQVALRSQNLDLGRLEPRSSRLMAGIILEQNPAANTTVPAASIVQLVLSTGPPFVLVPNLVGHTLQQARNELAAVDLSPLASPDDVAGDNEASVIAQSPGPLSSVPSGTTVRLTLSAAPRDTIFWPWVAGGVSLLSLAGALGYRAIRGGKLNLLEFVARPDLGSQTPTFRGDPGPEDELRIRSFSDEGEQTVDFATHGH